MAKSRPLVILSAAISLDGKIATKTGDSKLSSKKDKIRIHKLRGKVDAILVGSNTVKRDNPLLTVRFAKGKNPLRVILDSKASISINSRIIKTSKKTPTIIVVSSLAPKKKIAKLAQHPLEIIKMGKRVVNVKDLLKFLSERGIKKILLEGGGTVNWEFVRLGLVDGVVIALEPYLVGGQKGISLVEGEGFSLISNSKKLKLRQITRLGNEVILNYGKML